MTARAISNSIVVASHKTSTSRSLRLSFNLTLPRYESEEDFLRRTDLAGENLPCLISNTHSVQSLPSTREMKRAIETEDRGVSPPPLKRKYESTTTSQSVIKASVVRLLSEPVRQRRVLQISLLPFPRKSQRR